MFKSKLRKRGVLIFNTCKSNNSAESVRLWKTFATQSQTFTYFTFPNRVLFSIFVFHTKE